MKKQIFIASIFAATACFAQRSDQRSLQYSNMYIVEEEGDFIGWDLRFTSVASGYDLILYCGEGVVEGPVATHIQSLIGTQTVRPKNQVCGETLTFKFGANRTLLLKADEGKFDRVHKRQNFLKERWYR
jgi:hypothetical protein